MRFSSSSSVFLTALSLLFPQAHSIDLTVTDQSSIESTAKTIAAGLTSYYTGYQPGDTPGYLPDPYYWWECGAMFNTLINYWYYTGDTQYNAWVVQGLQHQASPTHNFMPSNATKSEGNDDQYFWGAAVMSAAELGFQNPDDGDPGWLALAQGVFNSQAARYDPGDCGGGMRWQIFTFNTGYNYKNTAANGGLFNLASRLGAYTGNQTYLDWAEKLWNWMYDDVHLIDPNNWSVYDGTSIGDNCTTLDHTLWTYTGGMMIHGAAVMYNISGSDQWKQRTQGLWTAASTNYFNEAKIMFEVCEATVKCNTDQQSFKAYLARFMAASSKLAPFLYDQMTPYMEASATAASQQCDGGTGGTSCGLQWTKNSTYDGNTGVGQQMAALEIVQSLLIKNSAAPVTGTTGGTSKGDASAGTGNDDSTLPAANTSKITTADKAGAGILTALVLIGTLGGAWFVLV